MKPPRVLTIAGSDPSGGAGLQADLKTFHAFGCYGMAVVTALTAQNTVGVQDVHAIPVEFVDSQIASLVADCPPLATKVGMLHSRAVIEVVARWAETGALGRLVVDPVMLATSGDALLLPDAVELLQSRLLPLAEVVTPNAPEAVRLLAEHSVGKADSDESPEVDPESAARRLCAILGTAVLVKGGHGTGETVRDALAVVDEEGALAWERPRLSVGASHGTGCTLSAGIAAGLSLGLGLRESVTRAGDFVHSGLRHAFAVGAGAVPVNHLAPFPGPDVALAGARNDGR